MSDNYQQWLDGEIGDSELSRRQSLDQSQTLFDLGVIRERERIIKLLEEDETYSILAYHIYGNGSPQELTTDLVGLIKGENK